MTDFLNFLRERIRQVRDIESTGHDLLHNAGDDAGYRAAWREVDRVRWALSDGSVRDALWALPDQAGSPLGHPCGAPAPAYDVFIFVHGQCAVNLASEACMDSVRFPGTSHAQPRAVRERAYRRPLGGAR